jgi:hypothetical protein
VTDATRWFRGWADVPDPPLRPLWDALSAEAGPPRRDWVLMGLPVGYSLARRISRARALVWTFPDGSLVACCKLRSEPFTCWWIHVLDPGGYGDAALLDAPAAVRANLVRTDGWHSARDMVAEIWVEYHGSFPSLTSEEWLVACYAESRDVRLAAAAAFGAEGPP